MALFRHCCGVDHGLTVDDCGGYGVDRGVERILTMV